MIISVITTTGRADPRLGDMAKCLLAALAKSDVELEWIVVDEKLWTVPASDRAVGIALELAAAPRPVADRFSLVHVPPPESAHRGPSVAVQAPAANTARNHALGLLTGEYAVFLSDCTVMTGDFLNVARDCALQGSGWRAKCYSVQDMPMPKAGPLRYRDHHDLLRKVPASTVGSPCWGAPVVSLARIHGFDLAYDGEAHGAELEAITRLGRSGVVFVTTERASCVELRRTKVDEYPKEQNRGSRNQKLIGDLARAGDRTLPLVEARFERRAEPELDAVVATAPVATPAAAPVELEGGGNGRRSKRRKHVVAPVPGAAGGEDVGAAVAAPPTVKVVIPPVVPLPVLQPPAPALTDLDLSDTIATIDDEAG